MQRVVEVALTTPPASDLAEIKRLPVEKRSDYTPFLIGNDTPLTTQQIVPYKRDKNFVLLGTALFRSVDIACKLAQTEHVFPTIVVIDNSQKTSQAWERIKTFFATTELTESDFLYDEDGFLELVLALQNENLIRVDTNASRFFSDFFKAHSLVYVKTVVEGLVVIEQDWGNLETFTQLKQIYSDVPIVTYSSNIIDFVDAASQVNVLKCIDCLKPDLSFCTNLDPVQKRPTLSHVFIDSCPLIIIEKLGLSEDVKAAFSAPSSQRDTAIEANDDTALATLTSELHLNDLEKMVPKYKDKLSDIVPPANDAAETADSTAKLP